ncbi:MULTISPECIES: YcgL domain-containing protein [Shewanella]|uniref:YcgL domain-containing protein NE535_00560 n=1 Tax=Shewanella holmiensis TaxID=2952222 RepID=A0A9X3AK14_9GAMM|nr:MULTISPECIES: YcgL domain-containing protein [Shewanella]MCT7940292.1 YcgL domain-containing protein [Shewanella holmiensis]MDP5147076.1 YcgL domain-containing protein [Shewanella sp. ULN5]
MICTVYKSSRKTDTYLFVEKRDVFDEVPQPLMEMFGTPKLVMLVPLSKRDSLALADIDKVKSELKAKGYYLQLPPPTENLLEQHKASINFESK